MRPLQTFSLLAATALFANASCAAVVEDDLDTGVQADELKEAKNLGMTDVTVLYPLPYNSDYYDDLMSPSSEGDRGELFLPEVFDQLAAVKTPPTMAYDGQITDPKTTLFAPWADKFANLRIVGIRLDPCFGESSNLGASTCQNTIRLVAQFIDPNGPASSWGVDGRVGIHLFYKVTRAELTSVLKGMLALRTKAGLPLQKGFIEPKAPQASTVLSGFGVNPTLVSEGLRGPYATGLRDLILMYAGSDNLSQVAFCVQDRGPDRSNTYYGENNIMSTSNRWSFGRFDVKEGTIYSQNVATLNFAGVQTSDIIPNVTAARTPLVVNPAAQTSESYFPRFNPPTPTLDSAGWANVNKAAYNFVNPTKYTAKTADCVSCHLADQGIDGPRSTRTAYTNANAYKSNTYRLAHSPLGAGPFRMFGWAGTGSSFAGSVVSTRVVNETAMVLDYINKSILK